MMREFCICVLALCHSLSSSGCDACALTMNPDPPERQRQRDWERYHHPWAMAQSAAEDRARQAAADSYRDQIAPGVGCEKCPEYCRLVDLRPIPYEDFARQFRQLIMAELHTTIVTGESPENVIEHNRLTCILESHDSMKCALGPLMEAREHPMVRFQAAILTLSFQLPAGDAEEVLFELAEGTGRIAKEARGLINKWNHDGWPEEQPYVPEACDPGGKYASDEMREQRAPESEE